MLNLDKDWLSISPGSIGYIFTKCAGGLSYSNLMRSPGIYSFFELKNKELADSIAKN